MLEFLNQEDLEGNTKLEIFKKIGIEAKPTDYAIYEAKVLSTNIEEEIGQHSYLITNTNYYRKNIGVIGRVNSSTLYPNFSTKVLYAFKTDCTAGIRPKIRYSLIKDKVTNLTVDEFGIKRGKYFRFMNRFVVGEEKNKILNYWGALERTENEYDVTATEETMCTLWFDNKEYMVVKDPTKKNNIFIFTVEPCNLIIDEKKDIAVFENIISYGLTGLKDDYMKNYYNCSEEDVLWQYLSNLYFRLRQEEPKNTKPLNQITLHLTEEMLEKLNSEKEITVIQEQTPQIKIKIDSSAKTFIKNKQ